MEKLKTNRVIKKIRSINKFKENLLYKICFAVTIIITAFLVITTILQINWLDWNEYPQPVLTWICARPLVGVFFIPFIIVVLTFCVWVMIIARPITLKSVLNDTATLLEYDDISKKHYDAIANELQEAKIINDAKAESRKQELELAKRKLLEEQNDLN